MKLYKFRTVDKYSLIGLLQSTLWFSDLNDFNDPFEGKYILNDQLTEVEINTLINCIYPDRIQELCANKGVDYIEDKAILYPILIKKEFENAFIKNVNNSKAICFSHDKEDKQPLYENLMWSHYADGLRGFCFVLDEYILKIDLNEQKLPIFPLPVDYRDTPKTIELSDYVHEKYINNESEVDTIRKVIETMSCKSKAWSYESEYRFFLKDNNNLVRYTSKALIEIVIGDKMPVAEQKQVILNARTANPAVTIKTARLKPNTYQLEIVDYIEPKNN